MGLITKNFTFSAGATIIASEHNSNFDTLFNSYNGNITNTNINASAAIALSKLALSDDVTFTGDMTITSSATTDNALTITASSLTTGSAISISSNSSSTAKRALLNIANKNSSATTATCIAIQNAASSCAIRISALGNGSHLRFLGDPAVSTPHDGDLWFTGSALNFRSGNATVDLMQTVKAWVNFDGDAVAIRDSFNVSSIGDIGTGEYQINWDTDFKSSMIAIAGFASLSTQLLYFGARNQRAPLSTASARISTWQDASTATDAQVVTVMAIGI